MKNVTSQPLFIFELANNHMGDVEHGLRIIRELHLATAKFDVPRAVKFQYRQLDTFIHPDYASRDDVKYVKRFRETRLTEDEFLKLKSTADELGFITICTGFDESSIDLIEKHGYDYIKIASCSLTDWPLLERIVKTSLPIFASVGGAALEDIDRVVSFFEHRNKAFTLMHCVAEYPTPDALLNLNQIDLLKSRYPSVPVGFSTHERPELLDAVKLAVAKGVAALERHVGIPTERYSLNAYSSTPMQAAAWVQTAIDSLAMCGVMGKRAPFTAGETKELQALRRGVFALDAIKAGEVIGPKNIFLAIPTALDQFTANDLSKYTEWRATADIPARGSINRDNAIITDRQKAIMNIIREVREFILSSKIILPSKADVEISHHFGVERFKEHGAVLLNYVNRSYCKKVIVLLPGQFHPEHTHRVKEETFFILHGSMRLSLDGVVQELNPGESVLVEPGVKHWFSTTEGVIFEEISSTHVAQDSFYTDPSITANKTRKTLVTYWLK